MCEGRNSAAAAAIGPYTAVTDSTRKVSGSTSVKGWARKTSKEPETRTISGLLAAE